MKRFKKILCFMGSGSDGLPGLEKAAELAERNGASLVVMDVLEESTEGPWLTLEGQGELESTIVLSRQQELAELMAPLEEKGIPVRTLVTIGNPFFEIGKQVAIDGHDLVIKTAQGGAERLGGLLGSTALHLLRKCPCPVWVVKPSTTHPSDRIVVAVDPDADKSGADELSVKVLELASSLAEARGSRLDIVHAWWLYSEAILRGNRIRVPPAEVDRILREARRTAESHMDDLLEKVDLSRVEHKAHLVKGQPFKVIRRFAQDADEIVLGTISRSGIEGLLIGNTAEKVLRTIDCSVLAVKPADFQSPLHF